MKKTSIILFLFFTLSVCFSQESNNNKTIVIGNIDTVDIHEQYLLVVHLPSKGIKTNSTYDGGYFVSYYIPADTAVFSVYSGKLPREPFITGTDCMLIDSILVDNVFFERRGFCLQSNDKLTNKRGFFREKEYMLLSYSAKYEWADVSKVERYDKIFSDIEYIEKDKP